MYNKLTHAKKWWKYYRTASNGVGHGIHSPFVFDFINNKETLQTKKLNKKKNINKLKKIKKLKRKLYLYRKLILLKEFINKKIQLKKQFKRSYLLL